MWRRQLGYLLHPSISTKEGLRVADVACGTGYVVFNEYVDEETNQYRRIWLLDLAKELPSAHVDGYDISSAQLPHPNWLPKNTTLSCLDILKPIPEHLRGVYDVVHVGLVVVVVERDDPLPLLDNLLALLSTNPFSHMER